MTCVFALWLIRVGEKYWDLGVKFRTFNEQVSLQTVGRYEASMIRRDIELGIRPPSMGDPHHLRAIQLYMPDASESQLNRDLPHSGRVYVKGSLVYPNGDLWDVKTRYRGDHFWHWAARKKSIRVKTKRSHLFERMRAFNLIAPKMRDQISGHISYVLAAELDLMVPRSEMVDVHINGRYRGVYLLLEQLEEMVLRKHGRMPGDLYAADMVGRNKYRGLSSQIFANHGLWEKVAINNHFDEGEDEALVLLIDALSAPPGRERSAKLRSLLDVDAFARFSAFRTLCQSEHFENTHNWRLYYDPWRNRFEPVVWDPAGWAPAWIPKPGRRSRADIVSSIVDEALLEDNAFLAARQAVFDEFFGSGGMERVGAEIDDVLQRIKPSIDSDPSLTYKIFAMTPDAVFAAQESYRKIVRTVGAHVREDYMTPGRLSYVTNKDLPGWVRVEVDGRRALTGLTLSLSRPIDRRPTAHVAIMLPEGPQLIDVSGAVVQRGSRIDLDIDLLAQFVPVKDPTLPRWVSGKIEVRPAYYDIILGGAEFAGVDIVEVTGRYGTRRFGVGEELKARAVRTLEPTVFANARSVLEPQPVQAPQVWEGDLEFEGVRTITDDVIIQPGTRLRMAPGASLIFEGRLVARGTAEQRIVFGPRDGGQDPWGIIALRGSGANGSELTHCDMSLGSGHKTALAEYSAMFSIHEVKGVVVRGCTFRDSRVVDDMVHAVYSTVHFEACEFTRSLFDAVDLDITEGVIESCRFIDSGNDALDLMTSTVLVRNSLIEGSVDKGVSVGEDTEAMLFNTTVERCEIGVQIKDRSRAVLVNCDILDNKLGVDAYKKNWRYDSGGFGYLYKSFFTGNEVTIGTDKHSRMMIHDCSFDTRIEPKKRVFIDATSDARSSRRAKQRVMERFPSEEEAASQFFQPAWSDVDPRVRGRLPSGE